MWNANGILIQGLNDKKNNVKNFTYQGINAYHQFPLTVVNDSECRKLTDEHQFKKFSNNLCLSLEFISNVDLYVRYLNKCIEMQIDVRALFIESEYSAEIWEDEIPQMQFLGYEYCPIPIDDQVITDIDWYKPFSEYWKKLNKYGLFDTYADAVGFVKKYNQTITESKIGDGEMDAYICRVSQVVL